MSFGGQNDFDVSSGPCTFEEINRRNKEITPNIFEGFKLIANKGLSNHFQLSHSFIMSSGKNTGYRFGSTYVGTKQISPTEAYPVLVGEISPSGDLTANIIHQLTSNVKLRLMALVEKYRWLTLQYSAEYRNPYVSLTAAAGDIDVVNGRGTLIGQCMLKMFGRVFGGVEALYRYPSSLMAPSLIPSIALRYTAPSWYISGVISPLVGAYQFSYFTKLADSVHVGLMYESSIRSKDSRTSLVYQVEDAKSDYVFKGLVDTEMTVGATMEKKLSPMPFTLVFSAVLSHMTSKYHFGFGLVLG